MPDSARGDVHYYSAAGIRPLMLMGCAAVALFLLLGVAPSARGQQYGDIDGDGDVDLDDLNIVTNQFGEMVEGGADLDGNGVVNIDDLKGVEKNFGKGTLVVGPAPASGAAIQLTPIVSRVTTPQGMDASVDWSPDGAGGILVAPRQGNVVVFVDTLMTIDNVNRPDAFGWANVQFDMTVSGELERGFDGMVQSWQLNGEFIDHDEDPSTPATGLFGRHDDLDVWGDMIDIVATNGLWTNSFDYIDQHRTLGQAQPLKLGFLIVSIDTDIVGSGGTVEAAVKAFSTFDENFDFGRNDGEMAGGLISIRVPPVACLIGDTDCNGIIDIDDLNNVRNNFGAVGPDDGTLPGDTFPYDGRVDIDDLNNVRNQFAAGTPVPEPATAIMLMFALAAWMPRHRRIRRFKA